MYNNKRIAVLTAGSVRGEFGGAERFYGGLVEALVQQGCLAEVINVPTDESNFESILAAYRTCSELDLSSYDLVISTKAPTYAVKHPNHVLYLVHTMRVFYDMFERVFPWADESMHKQRQIIQDMDTQVIGSISRRFSIGNEVSNRLQRWNGLSAEVLHPPLASGGFRHGPQGDYFFLPGRLHSWKRVDLVIRALQQSNLPLRLVIAGTGEAEGELKALAGGDPRIEFRGRITDQQLVDLYADSLAVPFVPLREDYGYVTLEAFASGKPVITCNDSGEPGHFVADGRTGLVCEPTPASVCEAMERLFLDRGAALRMGQRGAQSIDEIRWPRVAGRLLQAGFSQTADAQNSANATRRTKVAVLDMQPIIPAVGGGRLRLLGVYHALGEDIDARYVGTFDWQGEPPREHRIGPSLVEINVPLSDAHHEAARALAVEAGGKIVIDLAFAQQGVLSHDYLEKAREVIAWADAVVFSHPWVYPLVHLDLKPDQPIIYDSHNVEGLLRAQILNVSNPVELKLLRGVVEAELALGKRADLILACSTTDIDAFESLYGFAPSKMLLAPNGVMVSAIHPAAPLEKRSVRARLGLDPEQLVAIFIGSAYGPNVEAVDFIDKELAPAFPATLFVIAGGVGTVIVKRSPNVRITGPLDDAQRTEWLRASNLAVNPMFSGSGTNIKMFDFMAAGLPVLCTPTGARGITTVSGGGLRLASRGDLVAALDRLGSSQRNLHDLGLQNRQLVERHFAWERISPEVGNAFRTLVQRSLAKNIKLPRIAHLSTLGQVCGIGEYTSRLLDALVAHGVENYVVTCASASRRPVLETPDFPVEVGWYYDDERWCDSYIDAGVVARIKAWGADCVLIQYHSVFLSGERLLEFVKRCMQHEMAVAIEIHNYELSDTSAVRRLSECGCLLIAHNRGEIESASSAGIDLKYLPLLVTEPVNVPVRSMAGRDLSRHAPLIASTGFIRHHKGLPQLIEAMPRVRAAFPGAKLLLQCALYPSLDSQEEYERCLRAIEAHGLGDCVSIDISFRPIGEVHRLLSVADLVVLPYGPSNEGGSASATTALSSGVPLLVSDSKVFTETMAAAGVLVGTSPAEIADEICRLFHDAGAYETLAAKARVYTNRNGGPSVVADLLQYLMAAMGQDKLLVTNEETR